MTRNNKVFSESRSGKSSCIPVRYVFAVLAHFGFAVAYGLRVNLSVAIVAMVNSTQLMIKTEMKPECGPKDWRNSSSGYENGEFDWDQNTQGLILSSFFYGYVITQIPGGFLAGRIGGKWVFGLGILCTALMTLLTPIAAHAGVGVLIAVRVICGFGEGVTFPALYVMMARWSPPGDKTRLVGIAFSGVSLGTILSLPLTGLLCKYGFSGGWPSVFYTFGAVGVVWFIFWATLVYNTPEDHPWISQQELKHILQSTAESVAKRKNKLKVPWTSVLTSVPFWAIAAAHFCANWVFYTIITSLPTYYKDVLSLDIQENGFTSALPFAFGLLCQLFFAYLSDFLIIRGVLSTTVTRKMANSIAAFIPAALLIVVSYLGCSDTVLALVLMTAAVGIGSICQSGYAVNHLDIAPNFAHILLAITNSGGTGAGCIAPSVTGYFTENKPTREQWQKVFFVSAGLAFFGGLCFLLFASGKLQAWNGHIVNSEALLKEQSPESEPTAINEEAKPLIGKDTQGIDVVST